MGKKDLSGLIIKKNQILPKEIKSPEETLLAKKLGRKEKPIEEKQGEVISMKLTLFEFNKLKDKAGLVPLSTYIKHHIRTKTDLLD